MRSTSTVLTLLILALVCIHTQPAVAQQTKKSVTAKRIQTQSPDIDGILREEIWQNAEYITDFVQRDPLEGEPATVPTRVAFFYDDNALYIGAEMTSDVPVNSSVGRRDQNANADYLIISFDTYNDDLTAYSFGLTAGGTRLDRYHPSDNTFFDDDYDPVWEGKARVTSDGWSAEFRIPFSQMRFNEGDIQLWGVNINRMIQAKNEDLYWVLVPKDKSGWSSYFGDLRGIRQVNSSRKIEVTPYVAANSNLAGEINSSNPFSEKHSFSPRVGGDIKAGIGSNFTLDATINPDFGQVEADPAVVNLSAFETFFSEKRPFFIEGRQLLNGRGANYFFSRRIGAAPRGPASGDFVDRPDNTTILGAAKLTGRTSNGLSIGALGALTGKEFADTYSQSTDTFDKTLVNPLTGYGLIRLQQELDDKGSTFGGILTGVKRNLDSSPNLDSFFNRHAVTGAVDWRLRFWDGDYELTGDLGFSHVKGSENAILRLQTSSARYFQRPDARAVSLDSSRTTLNGYTGSLRFSRRNADHWNWNVSVDLESPEFELNDIGRLTNVNDISFRANVNYQENTPVGIFQNYTLILEGNQSYNYSGVRTGSWSNVAARATFKNFWTGFAHFFVGYPSLNDLRTRGGVLMKDPLSFGFGGSFSTNRSKDLSFSLGVFGGTERFGGGNLFIRSGITYRPGTQWSISLSPRFSNSTNSRQYIATLGNGPESTAGNRYIFSFIDRKTISTQIRLNYVLNPDLSLELYAEPFATSGNFYRFGELKAARSGELREYGKAEGTAIETDENGNMIITDNGDTFSIPNRDFAFLSFRSNLVLRWQWNPGSELFLVWGQDRSSFNSIQNNVRPGDMFNSLLETGDNFFAMKIRYWFSAL